ncbi:hypothetical protein ACNJYA_30680 [Bradyrhizobium sp. DASA03068]|uniref:hypothetical protein n=1 Tax=Bradyrhizobium sp. BLXBL-01 TaxID=3395915 RepID=UPI003F71E7C8
MMSGKPSIEAGAFPFQRSSLADRRRQAITLVPEAARAIERIQRNANRRGDVGRRIGWLYALSAQMHNASPLLAFLAKDLMKQNEQTGVQTESIPNLRVGNLASLECE